MHLHNLHSDGITAGYVITIAILFYINCHITTTKHLTGLEILDGLSSYKNNKCTGKISVKIYSY